MLLAALRSERDRRGGGDWAQPSGSEPWAGSGEPSPRGAEGRMLPSRASPSPPKLICSQSLRGHTPHVSRQYFRRWASVKGRSGKRSVTLLLENVRLISVQACGCPTPRSGGWGGGPPPAPPSRAVLGGWRPVPGNPRPWRRGRSRSLWGLHRPGTAGRCRNRGLCPRSCTPALAERGAGAGCRDAHFAPRRGPSWGPCWQLAPPWLAPLPAGQVVAGRAALPTWTSQRTCGAEPPRAGPGTARGCWCSPPSHGPHPQAMSTPTLGARHGVRGGRTSQCSQPLDPLVLTQQPVTANLGMPTKDPHLACSPSQLSLPWSQAPECL